MNNGGDEQRADAGTNISIYGHGTLAGDKINHPSMDGAGGKSYQWRPINLTKAQKVRIEGITIADSPYHSVNMYAYGIDNPEPNWVSWLKIFTWRGNGDGINAMYNTHIVDSFFRCQDDCCYTSGLGMARNVYWNDTAGSAFAMSPVGRLRSDLVIEDCDVIYARYTDHQGKYSRTFNMRGNSKHDPKGGKHKLIFRNIRVTDKRTPLATFWLVSDSSWTPWNPSKNAPGVHICNIYFENIEIASTATLAGIPGEIEDETLYGYDQALVYDIYFDNVVQAGKLITSLDHFTKKNQHVIADKIYFNTRLGAGDKKRPPKGTS